MAENPEDPNATTGRTRGAIKNKVTWLFALFIFGYMGAESKLLTSFSTTSSLSCTFLTN